MFGRQSRIKALVCRFYTLNVPCEPHDVVCLMYMYMYMYVFVSNLTGHYTSIVLLHVIRKFSITVILFIVFVSGFDPTSKL